MRELRKTKALRLHFSQTETSMSIETNIIAVGPWRPAPKPLVRPPEMAKKSIPVRSGPICRTEGCQSPAWCTGLCRTCYNRNWNASRAEPNSRARERPISGDQRKKCFQLEAELKEARSIYDRVMGLDNRLRWRRKIDILTEALREAQEEEEKCAASCSLPGCSAC